MMPGLVLTCEHASNALPPGVDLGVGREVMDSHVAWDPGAKEVARELARRWGCPLQVGRYSRLYVDLNRSPDRPVVVPEVAFGVRVPGNVGLPEEERAARLREHHAPFREAVIHDVAAAVARAGSVLHLSIHSFADKLGEERRPYPLGVLYDPDRPGEREIAEAILERLRAAGWDARANQPYPGTGDGTTTWLRGVFQPRVYAGLEIELSHALDEAGLARATDAMADAVEGVFGDDAVA